MKAVDLNCDMGELKEGQEKNYDEEIMPFISSCNVACGFHSGDPLTIQHTIQTALKHGVQIGAHPSYNDRENFGRLSISIDLEILMAEIRYQICAVKGIVESFGTSLSHVKPHGALYNDMVKDEVLAEAFVKLVKTIDPKLKIFALAHSQVIDICKKHQMSFVNEGFADRKYQKIDQLRSRQHPDAVIHDSEKVLQQIANFLDGKVQLFNSGWSNINVDSLCLHSDTKGAVELSQTIHKYLIEQNVQIAASV